MSGPAIKKVPAVPSPSSSLIIISPLLEESPCGYDYRLVMVRRNAKSSFKNGTVFPGGNMDPCDRDRDSTSTAGEKPSLDAFRRCAVRETFEETGILVANPRIQFLPGERTKWRAKVHDSGEAFGQLLREYKTEMDLDGLVHYANWITPIALSRRYDTNFFLTVVSSEETLPARMDRSETLQINHFTPTEAITAHKNGEIVLFLPQLYMLHDMSLYKEHQMLLEAVKQRQIIPTQPQMQKKLGIVALPGDETRGGATGTLNRIHVTMQEGNFMPSRVVRRNLLGYTDMETEDVFTSVESALLKSNL